MTLFYTQGVKYALDQLNLDPKQRYQQQLDERFKTLKHMLTQYGQKTDTGHKRILIPRNALNVQNIRDLGFIPVKMAVPEKGQSTIRSFRNPFNNYHIHEHGKEWTMHQDKHRASTMMGYKKQKTPSGAVKLLPDTNPLSTAWNTIKGLPHTIGEGIPGLYYHLRNTLSNTPGIEDKLKKTLKPEYLETVKAFEPLRMPRKRRKPQEITPQTPPAPLV